ncbi:hypothetical protein ACP8Y2_05850 [Herpetosiphon llansteffanensis]
MTATNSTTPAFTKEIRFDRITEDFALYLNGELIGYTSSYSEGESRLNELVYDLLRRASHADMSDLTPEEAEVALEVVTALAAEETAEVIIEEVMVVSSEDATPGPTVDELAPAIPAAPTPTFVALDPTLPASVAYQLGDLDIDLTDGVLEIASGKVCLRLRPYDAHLLLTFMRMPHVVAMIEQNERANQQRVHDEIEYAQWQERYDRS